METWYTGAEFGLKYRFSNERTEDVHTQEELFVGIDVGTGGVRTVAATATGQVVAQSVASLEDVGTVPEEDRHEQPPEAWWNAVCMACRGLHTALDAMGTPREAVVALAVDGTSGTVVAVDAAGVPVRPGIMYNDPRAHVEANALNAAAESFCHKLGYRFAASYALAKIAWLQQHEPQNVERTARFVHQADYVVGCLTGDFSVSDYSNALKTGYDLVDEEWPDWIATRLGVTDRLPRVVAPGTPVGTVSAAAAEQTGLPRGASVVAGATDGTAACLASGVRNSGDYNTTVGTTLVFKGISDRICSHPDGLIYSHKLPGGRWLPGAASNTGGEWIPALFPGEDAAALDAAAHPLLPSRCLAYPLMRKGERFPFLAPKAGGFCTPAPASKEERFAAYLQGVAFVERMGYDLLDAAGGTAGGAVFSTGGGSRSNVWMQCRADATGRVLHRPAFAESAFGSAVLAAAGVCYGDVWQAVKGMVHVVRTFSPDKVCAERCDALYNQFTAEMKRRGYQ